MRKLFLVTVVIVLGWQSDHWAIEYNPQALVDVFSEVKEAKRKNKIPLGVYDIDDTLLSSNSRYKRILLEFVSQREIASLYPFEVQMIRRHLDTIVGRYFSEGVLQEAGIENKEFIQKCLTFFMARLFRHEYFQEDIPTAGAVKYVRRFRRVGGTIIYFTGRWEDMRSLTMAHLVNLGFPAPNGRDSYLLMKPDQKTGDFEYKRTQIDKIFSMGKVVAGFENEPSAVNLFKERFPGALVVFLDTKNSGQKDSGGRLITPLPGIPWVRNFILPKWYSRIIRLSRKP